MKLQVNGRIWLEGDERFMGIGRMELLEHIRRTGSINQAAKAMKMSYKRAWEMVHSMNEQSPTPLVATQTGGERGGGALVTAEGERYLQYYQQLQDRFQAFLKTESAAIPF